MLGTSISSYRQELSECLTRFRQDAVLAGLDLIMAENSVLEAKNRLHAAEEDIQATLDEIQRLDQEVARFQIAFEAPLIRKTSKSTNKPVDLPELSGSSPEDKKVILIYPPDGKRRVTVTNADLKRLKPGVFLNDVMIECALDLSLHDLQEKNMNLAEQFHIFSPFFYTKLTGEGYPSVCKWTSRFDIFRKKYILVPINQNLHWYLAIIHNAEAVLEPPASHNTCDDLTDKTYILIFDSLGTKHPEVIDVLAQYLKSEASEKKKMIFSSRTTVASGRHVRVPLQLNSYDCGVYLIHYARIFMSDPRRFSEKIIAKKSKNPILGGTDLDWHTKNVASLRNTLHNTLSSLSEEWKKEEGIDADSAASSDFFKGCLPKTEVQYPSGDEVTVVKCPGVLLKADPSRGRR